MVERSYTLTIQMVIQALEIRTGVIVDNGQLLLELIRLSEYERNTMKTKIILIRDTTKPDKIKFGNIR